MTENFLHIKKGGYVSKELLLAYLTNALSDAENKRIAQLIEEDPFLADAVDGLKLADKHTISTTLDTIYKDVDIIVGNKKAFTLSATVKKYAAAAMLLVFFGLTYLIMNVLNNSANNQTDIAMAPENKNTVIDDSSDMGAGDLNETSNAEKINAAEPIKTIIAPNDYVEDLKSSSLAKEPQAVEIVDDAQKSLYDYKQEDMVVESSKDDMESDNYLSIPQTESNAGVITTTGATDVTYETETVTVASKKDVKVSKEKKQKATTTDAKTATNVSLDEVAVANDTILFAEQMPEFPGGTTALNAYFIKNINYAQCANAMGTVYVKFLVTIDGSLSSVTIARGINTSADAEVLRVIKTMPKWNPGKQNGKTVNVWMTIPVKLMPTE